MRCLVKAITATLAGLGPVFIFWLIVEYIYWKEMNRK